MFCGFPMVELCPIILQVALMSTLLLTRRLLLFAPHPHLLSFGMGVI
jgi:hypothetical protein